MIDFGGDSGFALEPPLIALGFAVFGAATDLQGDGARKARIDGAEDDALSAATEFFLQKIRPESRIGRQTFGALGVGGVTFGVRSGGVGHMGSLPDRGPRRKAPRGPGRGEKLRLRPADARP